jgi:hypothetical protein
MSGLFDVDVGYEPVSAVREWRTEHSSGSERNLYACSVCAAVVSTDGQEKHTEWHRRESSKHLLGF